MKMTNLDRAKILNLCEEAFECKTLKQGEAKLLKMSKLIQRIQKRDSQRAGAKGKA